MINPIRNYILVRPFPSDEKSAGGIIVSEAHRAISNKMKVIAVGNGTKKEPMRFKIDDIVFRVKDHGNEVLIDGQMHFLIEQSHLIAKLN
jgi:chaperonin GroES